MTSQPGRRLLLDEMYAPRLARIMRDEGFDVTAVLEHPELRSASDSDLFEWAADQSRRMATENIADFCALLRRAADNGAMTSGLLLVDGRVLPRARPGPLLAALRAWLTAPRRHRELEEWLRPAPDGDG